MTEKDKIQDRINEVFAMFDSEYDPREVRSACKEIGIGLAEQFGEDIDAWEKSQLASAIAALKWNLVLSHPVSETGLRLAIHSLNKALVPKELRSSDYPLEERDLETVTVYDLIAAFNEM